MTTFSSCARPIDLYSWTDGTSNDEFPSNYENWRIGEERYGPWDTNIYYPQPPVQYPIDVFKDLEIEALKNDVKLLKKKLTKTRAEVNKFKKQLNPPLKPGKRQFEL